MDIINEPASLQRWYSYEYVGPGHVFHAVRYEKSGGPDNLPFIWADDSMWSIDTPESPHSILPLLFNVIDLPASPIDLQDAEIKVCLRGEHLDLKGGYCLLWILSSLPHSNRWHLISSPLEITQGEWGKPNLLSISSNPENWHNSFCNHPAYQPSLSKTLKMVTSIGISFVGFSEKVTGRLALSAFHIKNKPSSPNWPYAIGKNKINCGWQSVCHHKKKQIPSSIQSFYLKDGSDDQNLTQCVVSQDNYLLFSTPVTTFCYLTFVHAGHTTQRHTLANAIILLKIGSINLDLKNGKIHFFIEHADSETRWIFTHEIVVGTTTSNFGFILSEDANQWRCISGKNSLKATIDQYDYFGFMVVSAKAPPAGTFCLFDFSIGPNF